MEQLHPRLAVDLGTTWTAACLVSDSGVVPVPLGSGHPSMPSVVARDGDRFLVGEVAEQFIDGRPGSGAREVKRRFGDTTPVVIDGQPFGADALMAEILRHVAGVAYPDGWSDVDVVLTHPANWGAYKLELLANVGQQAGFRQVGLQSEPVAAAMHFVETGRVQPGDVVAVYDFGGGTFDAAVVRVGADASVLGTPQGLERLGGIDIDQMVFAHVAASLDGGLSQLDSTDPDVRRGVARLRAECTKAKEALSSDSDAMIPVSLPSIQTKVRITRPELEAILRQRIDETLATLDRSVASAGVSADDLAAVVLVGGSSQIPLVAERVRAHVGRPTLFGSDPKLVVASGALEGALHAGRSTVADAPAAAAPAATASPKSTKPSEESTMSDAIPPEVAGAAAAAAAAANRDKTNEVTATVAPEVSAAAAEGKSASASTAPTATPTATTAATTAATSRDAGSRTPEAPPAKPTESRAGRIAGGVVGAAAAVAGGIIFHEQLAAATGIDPQVGADAIPGAAAMGAAAASAAAAAAGTAAGSAASLEDRDEADDADGVDAAGHDVDTQLLGATADAPADDGMDAFDDDPATAAAETDPVGGTPDGDATLAGDVLDAFVAAVPEPMVIAPEPDFAGNTAPPIDDYSSVFDPPAPTRPTNSPVQPATLGPKVGLTEPTSRPSTYQPDDDDDGPQRGGRGSQPMNAPAPPAVSHPTSAPAQPQPQMQPPTAAAPTATAPTTTTAPQATPSQPAAVQPPTVATVAPADAADDSSAASSSTVPDGDHDPGDSGDPAFDVAKARLLERVATFNPIVGATAAETADLKADLQQMIDQFEPRPGESTTEALAALRAQYDDRVRDFTQDQKIDALIDETRRDNAREKQEKQDAPDTQTSTRPADDTPADSTSPTDDDPAATPLTEIPRPDVSAQMTPPPPPGDEEEPPIELHFDKAVDQDIAQKTTEILRQMEAERRSTFAGGIQDPATTMQFYANQQVHMAAIQQLVNDQQAVALETDGGMPSDELLVKVNEATAGLVNKANIAMTQASQGYANATGGLGVVLPMQLAVIPVVMPALPDPDTGPEPEPEPEAPPTAYELVEAQVLAANQALQTQAAITGAPFQPIQVPMDPDSNDIPDLAAINAAVTQQVAIANQMMAQQAAILGRPIQQVPIPVITLPDDMLGDTATTGGSATTTPDEGDDGATGASSQTDAPSAYEAVAAQIAVANQSLQAQATASGLQFQPIQVPMDSGGDEAPDLAAINASVAQQVSNANAVMAQQAAAMGRGIVPIQIPTISLPDELMATTGDSATTGGSATTSPDEGGAGDASRATTALRAGQHESAEPADPAAADDQGAIGGASNDPSTWRPAEEQQDDTHDVPLSGAPSLPTGPPIVDPFDTHMSHAEDSALPDDPGLVPMTDAQLHGQPEPSEPYDINEELTGHAAGTDVGAGEQILTGIVQNWPSMGNPAAQGPAAIAAALDVLDDQSKPTGYYRSSKPGSEYGNAEDQSGASGDVDEDSWLPSVPDAATVTDVLGNVDATNTMQAPDGATDGIELPTIPDIVPQNMPAPPAPLEIPVVPEIVIPDIVIPDIPALPSMPDLSELPDLPDAPDFSDSAQSFGDDIGGDVTPPDPTSTEF